MTDRPQDDLVSWLDAELGGLGIGADDLIAVACSGGADSIAALDLTVRTGRAVVVLHVDHRLRQDSARDADFVVDAARSRGVRVHCEAVVVDPAASLEAAARDARYAALRRMAAEAGAAWVITAHTMDDQAETVLLRAMRGGSLDAIVPVRSGNVPIVRPFLRRRRAELRSWLTDHGIPWLEDPSNADLRFDRNWVRHVIIPLMRERRSGVDAALALSASHQAMDREALDDLAAGVFARARIDDLGVFVADTDLASVPVAVAFRVVRDALRHAGANPSSIHVRRAMSLRSGHMRVGTTDVLRLADGYAFLAPHTTPDALDLPAEGLVDDAVRGLRIRVGPASVLGREPSWRWRALIDGRARLLVRPRRPGDRVKTRGGTRKVQDVLVDAKVPRPLRDLVGVVADPSGALAVVGHAAMRGAGVSGTVVDVEPLGGSWARELLWNTA